DGRQEDADLLRKARESAASTGPTVTPSGSQRAVTVSDGGPVDDTLDRPADTPADGPVDSPVDDPREPPLGGPHGHAAGEPAPAADAAGADDATAAERPASG